MLTLYREALRLRREAEGLYDAGLQWREAPEGVLDFERGSALRCVVNLSGRPLPVPAEAVLLASQPLEDGELPHDAAAWLRVS